MVHTYSFGGTDFKFENKYATATPQLTVLWNLTSCDLCSPGDTRGEIQKQQIALQPASNPAPAATAYTLIRGTPPYTLQPLFTLLSSTRPIGPCHHLRTKCIPLPVCVLGSRGWALVGGHAAFAISTVTYTRLWTNRVSVTECCGQFFCCIVIHGIC